MNNISVLKEIFALEAKRTSTDSKVEEEKIKEGFKGLNPKQFDGTLVKLKSDRIGRIYHSYYGVYKWYGQKYLSYKWSSNMSDIKSLENIEIIERDELDYEALEDIDKKINTLENELDKLKEKRYQIVKKCVHLVHPDSLEETDEENRNVFNMGGHKVYYSAGVCELCGTEIKS